MLDLPAAPLFTEDGDHNIIPQVYKLTTMEVKIIYHGLLTYNHYDMNTNSAIKIHYNLIKIKCYFSFCYYGLTVIEVVDFVFFISITIDFLNDINYSHFKRWSKYLEIPTA